jgi:mannose-6-phosphate isomerase-like protein (cupin superfamily)
MIGLTVEEALHLLAAKQADYLRLIEDATYDIGIYKPEGIDPQTPHTRDELYIVGAGTGEFVCGGETRAFAPGDLLFVSAGVEHRFLNFSKDFSVCVVFFRPRP